MGHSDIELYKKSDGGLRCVLCPHFCVLKKDQFGRCLVCKSDGEKIYLYSYGYLTNIAFEPIEKKPLFHFMPKTKTLSIGSWGCNLSCKFCENFDISQRERKDIDKYFAPEHIVNIAQEKHCKSVCMTYNEPTVYYEYLIDVANKCHDNDIKFIIKTNGYVNKEPWRDICQVSDAMNIDWKGNAKQYRTVMGGDSCIVRDRIKEASNFGIHIEISIPLYHNFLEDIRTFWEFGSFLNSVDKNIPCHLLKIVGANKHDKYSNTSDLEIDAAHSILSFYMKEVHLHF